ncbi:MAG: penicillin-binding protein [Pseudonocardia sp.]|nr:penicillin-binding protein [Pseudonocardia sp.]
MPLLTHEETGTESVARSRAVALAERPPDTERGRIPARPTRKSPWKRVRQSIYVLLGLAVLGPIIAFAIGWFLFSVPTPDQVSLQQVSRFTFADGSDLATVRPEGANGEGVNRSVVRLVDIPQHTRDAVLAAENREFYTDPGFDITGILRAVYNQVTGGVGGGSTITQQYVKVVTGNDDFSLIRKYKEVVLAVKITREQSKDEILENYLNVIYMGRGSYGIQAASQAYFGKDVADLTVSDSAMLAGLIQAPSRWDPAKDLEGSQRRWTYVLDQMTQAEFVTPADRAVQLFPAWLPTPPEGAGRPSDARNHIVNMAQQEVIDRQIATREQFDTEGLTITTTVDPVRQQEAVDAVTSELDGQPPNLRGALVSIDPTTGAVQSYYGGSDGQGTNYANSERPPGSSYKPFVLAAAMLADPEIGLGTNYDGASGQELAGTVINNSEGFDCGRCSVQTAMTRSINTIFYQLGLAAGPQRVIDAAHSLGIPADLATDPRGGIALGDQDVHPIDMASAYATLAADGVYRAPYMVARVTAADGRVLYEAAPDAGRQAIDPQIARNVTEAMIDVTQFARIDLDGGRAVAGKTGTVQAAQDGQNKDAWMVGYTPSLATAVWIGTDLSDPIQDENGSPIYGRMVPGAIWQNYMNAALEGTPDVPFSPFVPRGQRLVAEPSGDNGGGTGPSTAAAPENDDQDNGNDDDQDDNDDNDAPQAPSDGDDNDGNDNGNDDNNGDDNGDNNGDDNNGDNGNDDNNGDNNDSDDGE